MASIHKEMVLATSADAVWDAVRDFGAVHTRLAPGFVTDAKMDDDARIVTFASGVTAREVLVDCDDARRRLVYAITNERIRHYNAVVQIAGDGDKPTRFLWTIDVMPHDIAPYISAQMDLGIDAMKKKLGGT
ncbi:SRPBCC family protein [Afipia clevelandensis]|uniref:SRPBCC family protein n=1 Tax=Afipia clevelandensis ATCC 49720 TaxID=883079 RepID=K8NVZ1_9BRAD|nr:SRPBCC family protein [Afipia clevelandensis]EKS33321.1 hypothetical protein HMPREF9696_03362 [Afipia clevelandensis ATCC 49720]